MFIIGEHGSHSNDDGTTTKIVKNPTDKNEYDDDCSNELFQIIIVTYNNRKKVVVIVIAGLTIVLSFS